jgi:hypothetical protein
MQPCKPGAKYVTGSVINKTRSPIRVAEAQFNFTSPGNQYEGFHIIRVTDLKAHETRAFKETSYMHSGSVLEPAVAQIVVFPPDRQVMAEPWTYRDSW